MTLEHDDAQVVDAPVSWTAPETDLWVASRSGEYAGMVEFHDGHFVARDSTGNEIGFFSSIPAAQAAVDAAAATSSPRATRSSRPTGIARVLRSRQGGATL